MYFVALKIELKFIMSLIKLYLSINFGLIPGSVKTVEGTLAAWLSMTLSCYALSWGMPGKYDLHMIL